MSASAAAVIRCTSAGAAGRDRPETHGLPGGRQTVSVDTARAMAALLCDVRDGDQVPLTSTAATGRQRR
jgi:hypothetical protein